MARDLSAERLMPAVSDSVWREQDTTPSRIEAAVRDLLKERFAEAAGYAPARALNMVCIVDREWSGEIANRLRQVGRYHASRTVVLSYDPRRTTMDATVTVASDSEPRSGELTLLRETIIVGIGPRHLAHVETIVDPLVVTDLPTLVWSPHGHDDAVDRLLSLAQVVLMDSVDEPDVRDGLRRAAQLLESVYVVDLAWLRSTPWRERVAATFDPPRLRLELRTISAVTVRHHPDSAAAALLLIGWLGSRLDWRVSPLVPRGGALCGSMHARRQDVDVRLVPDTGLHVRGLNGLTLETASGRCFSLDRGPGGLRARYANRRGDVREWVVVGASRGEGGILGEGIRQALLRDPTYGPALRAANTLVS